MGTFQQHTIRSSKNFWFPSLLNEPSSFPLNLYSNDFSHISIDALQLSAVSPLLNSILDDAYTSNQCSWSRDSYAVIFPDSPADEVKYFFDFITLGSAQFQTYEQQEQVKKLIKALNIRYLPVLMENNSEDVECNVEIKEEDSKPEGVMDHDGMLEQVQPSQFPNFASEEINEDGTTTTTLNNQEGDGFTIIKTEVVKKPPPAKPNVKCEHCGMDIGEKNSWTYMLHMSGHVGQQALQCVYCKFVLRNRNDWKNHMEGESGSKKRKVCCGICGEVFVGNWNFIVHKRDAHEDGKPIRCGICNAILTSFGAWKRHKNELHVKVVCQVCGVSVLQSSLKNHMKIQHFYDPEVDAKSCKICGKKFTHEFTRDQHEKAVHKQEANKICELCGKAFRYPASLRYHIEAVHKGNSKWKFMERIHACKICGKKFKGKKDLEYHEKRHDNSGFFKCNMCEKHFGTQERLKIHVNSYHSKIKYECLVCGKQFCVISQAKIHCFNHNTAKIRSYQCELCLEWFESKDTGATHIKRYHMNEPVKPTIRHKMTDEFQQLMKHCIRELP